LILLSAMALATTATPARSQFVSRELSARAPAGSGASLEQVVSRELSVRSTEGDPSAPAVVSRELSVLAPGGGSQDHGVVSREVSVRTPGGVGDSISIVSRELSIGVELGSSDPPSVVSRELAVYLAPGAAESRQVISRELSLATPIPDLTIRNLQAPNAAVASSTVQVSWETDNIGLGVANPPWIDRVYLSTDNVFDSSDTFLQLSPCSATLTPQSPPLQCSASVPLPNLLGNYYLIVVVDADASVFELDEVDGNNIAAIPIELTPIPIADLTITGINAPASATDGQPVTLSWSEANVGTLDALGTWGARIEYSLSATGSAPVFLTEIPQPGPLAHGASLPRSALVTVPGGLSGDIWFIVTTDSQGQVPEISETNNTLVAAAPTLVLQPNKPDLQVASITPPAATFYVNNAYTVAYRVENRDDNGAANGAWVDRIYLSFGDAVPDPGEEIAAVSNALQLGPCPSGAGCPGYTRTFLMPQQVQPGAYWLIVDADADGALEETNDGNNRLVFPIAIETASYTATVQASLDEALAGAPGAPVAVTFAGQAIDLITGNPVPNVAVTVRVRNKGTRRVYDLGPGGTPLTTDGAGAFTFLFEPLDYEAGYFDIFAGHPAVVENPSQPDDTFVLHGLRVTPSTVTQNVFVGTSLTGQLTLRNLGDNPLGLSPTLPITASASGAPSNLQVEFLNVPATLAPNQQATATYRLTAAPPPITTASPVDLEFAVPVNGALLTAAKARVNAFLPDLTPALTIVPGPAGFSSSNPIVAKRQPPVIGTPPNPPAIAQFLVRNDGGAAATNCRVFLPCLPNPGACLASGENCTVDPSTCPNGLLLSAVTALHLGDIPPGESRPVEVALTPSRNHPVGQGATPSLRIECAQTGPAFTQVHYRIVPHDSEQGDLRIRVESEFTYWDSNGQPLNGNGPLLHGARVRVYDTYTGAIVGDTLTPDGGTRLGIADFSNLVEGFYRVVVEKPGHSTIEKTVQILTGQQSVTTAFLQTAAVTYTWTVVPTNIVDQYIISIQATFNTFVPAPKILIDTDPFEPGYQPTIELDLQVGEVRQVDLRIKNEGFIAAQNVLLYLNNPPGYEITALVTDFGTVGAQEEFIVPTTVRRVAGLAGPDCYATVVSGVQYCYVCGVLQCYWSPVYLRYPIDTCGGVPSGGAPPGGGGGGSSGSGGYFGGPTFDNTTICEPPPLLSDDGPPCQTECCEAGASDGGGPGGRTPAGPQPTVGDPIHLYSGELRHTETDLRIRGRGFDFVWTREYRSKRSPHTAQGFGWDFAYNRRVERSGAELIVYDGHGRIDLHSSPSLNTWVRDEYFHEFRRESDGRYVKSGGDRNREYYRALDGAPAQGKLDRIVDRNGNTMVFEYDAAGRLERVIDTLGRPITLTYNADGYIAAITDFVGRTVAYSYYQNGDAGGSAGDLKSVTTPAVVGTPNGNDYPQGKTETYTYTTGFFDARLNHNLTSITDGRGQVYVATTYHPTVDPLDRNFDRAIAQTWGYSGESYEIVYYPQAPTIENGQSALQVIVNDRVGNVCEYDFDVANRLIRKRDYTGRAMADQPTTRSVNRPGAPLRASDPPYFETRWGYNVDSLVTRIDHPDGTLSLFEYEIDLLPGAPRTARGNLRQVRRLPGTHTPVGDQPELVEEYEYDANIGGGCCNNKFLTRYVDPRGNQTLNEYDSRGNRTKTTHPIPSIVDAFEYDPLTGQLSAHVHPDNGSGSRRRDEFYYYESGPSKGYLLAEVIDVDGFGLTTIYQYDALGRVIRVVDPRGNDTLYVYNDRDQVVRERSRSASLGIRYETDSFYDENDNLVRVDVQNRDEFGAIAANSHLTTLYEYGILNELTRVCQEVGNASLLPADLTCATIALAEFVTTEYVYDANRNRALVRSPLAVSGEQPDNQVLTEYDERDLVLRVTRGWGSGAESIQEYDYDEDGNLVVIREGLPGTPHLTNHRYDAYDRRVDTTDALGNKTSWHYDANGNRTSQRVDGELLDDVPGSAGNTLLAETVWLHDAMDRVTREDRSFFDYATGAIGDGSATALTSYADNGQVVSVANDNAHATTTSYDAANRVATVTDAKGNTVSYGYDGNSNVVTVTEVEKSDLGAPDESFVTTYAYDALDRQISVTNNLGHVRQSRYDSRNNEVVAIDPRGNVVKHFYDGLDRLVRTERVMTDNGTGAGTALPYADWIVTYQRWDASSRLVGQTDDNLNETQYVYDALGRKTATVYADGTRFDTTYNTHDDAVQTLDANGSLVTMAYDALHRIKSKSVQRGPGVVGTTFEVYKHDGLSRMTWGEDDDSLITMSYDSLSHLIEEVQNGHVVGSSFDGVGNQVSLVYPNGRIVNTTYDALERKKTISDASGPIVTYFFAGPSRPVRKDYGNNTRMLLEYDGAKRTTRTSHVRDPAGTAVVFDDRHYTWDASSNQTAHNDIVNNSLRTYSYDSVDRLIRSVRVDNGGAPQQIDYYLDGVGNRTLVVGGPDAGVYSCDPTLPEPADCQVNQYTSAQTQAYTYDAAGSTLTATITSLMPVNEWDYARRLSATLVHGLVRLAYTHDVLGRRLGLEKAVLPAGSLELSIWSGWQQIDTLFVGLQQHTQVVFGLSINEEVQRSTASGVYSRHEDYMRTTRVVTAQNSSVVERYDYDDYGFAYFVDASGNAASASSIDMDSLFAGMQYELATRRYVARYRVFDPSIGRFLSRDPLGAWDHSSSVGSGLHYAGNNPASRIDPYGLRPLPCPTREADAISDRRFVKGKRIGDIVFHCGYKCYKESRRPRPGEPLRCHWIPTSSTGVTGRWRCLPESYYYPQETAECCYSQGRLVSDPCDSCRGSNNYFPDENVIDHTFNDPGGPSGIPFGDLLELMGHSLDVWSTNLMIDYALGVSSMGLEAYYGR
jgi:RHS repeat-associated protein